MRTYERTHPWLTFRIDLRRASYRLWVALGEAQSKCEHIAGVPLKPAVAKFLHQLFLAKGALATTAIEGNTLTEEEVQLHLQNRLELPPSKDYLAQEIDNIVEACNGILNQLAAGVSGDLTPQQIHDYNKLVLKNLSLPAEVIPGAIRTYEVSVGRYPGAPAQYCELLIERLCNWLNSEEFQPPAGYDLIYGLMKAIVAHLYLAWIHPFGDGNGRVARLVEYQILVASGIPSTSAHLLSNHYNETRSEYYRLLDQASVSGGDILPFVEYAVRGFVEGLRNQLDLIRIQQWEIVWCNYIDEHFRNLNGKADIRRHNLILDLSRTLNPAPPVPIGEIQEISPRVAAAYATKNRKTLLRDIEWLTSEGLVQNTPEGIVPNRDVILAFLPLRKSS